MKRDPHYQSILAQLDTALDPDNFEHCAADVLRPDFPSLVPIRGGSDAGMDGAIADCEGVAYPLVTTTGEDVIGNLTRNLTTYLAEGGARRKAILATSAQLTARRRRNLEERASKLGFTLVQTTRSAAIADRLYDNPRWCRELLGLSGEPPALSVEPGATPTAGYPASRAGQRPRMVARDERRPVVGGSAWLRQDTSSSAGWSVMGGDSCCKRQLDQNCRGLPVEEALCAYRGRRPGSTGTVGRTAAFPCRDRRA